MEVHWQGEPSEATSVPRLYQPREHREDEAADHSREPLRARHPREIKQAVQHATHSRSGASKAQGDYVLVY